MIRSLGRRFALFLLACVCLGSIVEASDVWPPQSVSDGLNYLYRHLQYVETNNVTGVSGGILTQTNSGGMVVIVLTVPAMTNAGMASMDWVYANFISSNAHNTNVVSDGSRLMNTWVGHTNVLYIVDPTGSYTNKIGTFFTQ